MGEITLFFFFFSFAPSLGIPFVIRIELTLLSKHALKKIIFKGLEYFRLAAQYSAAEVM